MDTKDLKITEIESVTAASVELHITPEQEKQLLWKIDIRLIPILWLLFMCAFLDRINIGNARIQGLEKDLHMKGSDYNIALFVFFIPYILFEVPSNILLKRMRPPVFLSCIIGSWGLVTVGQGLTKSFGGLVACRFIIGFLEAGFLPGCIYLISMYYKRHELQWRMTLFFSGSIIAGAFSGLLAYGIAHMDRVANLSGWRWIFVLEGIATVFVAILAFFIVPDWPRDAKFLSDEQRAMLLQRLATDVEGVSMDRLDKHSLKRIFTDVKIYLGCTIYIGIVVTSYSTAFFTPTILKQLGWTSLRAQVMTIPIYVVATAFALLVAVLTDHFKHRFLFIVGGCLTTVFGYGILLNMLKVHVAARYFAIFCIACGCYSAQSVSIVWLSNNLAGHYKRGFGSAMQISLGNIGGIAASNIFLPTQAPTYLLGFGFGLGMVGFCFISATLLYIYLKRENQLRDGGHRDSRLDLPDSERDNLGDDHPSFRFTL